MCQAPEENLSTAEQSLAKPRHLPIRQEEKKAFVHHLKFHQNDDRLKASIFIFSPAFIQIKELLRNGVKAVI